MCCTICATPFKQPDCSKPRLATTIIRKMKNVIVLLYLIIALSGLAMVFGRTVPRTFVETLIRNKKVVVFSKPWCSYSRKAKQALDAYHLSERVYQIVELDTRTDGAAIKDVLGEITGRRTVPRVFICGKFVGGGDETESAHRSGQLERMLEDCGAI